MEISQNQNDRQKMMLTTLGSYNKMYDLNRLLGYNRVGMYGLQLLIYLSTQTKIRL